MERHDCQECMYSVGHRRMTTTNNQEDRRFVTALARGLRILQAFTSGEERLSNLDIARHCGLPKTTVTRLTYTLTQLGFLHHTPETGRYRLGLAALTLRRTAVERLDLYEAKDGLPQAVANKTRTMVSLTIRDELSILYVDSCRNQNSVITLHLDVGSHLPLINTAAGWAHVIASPPKVRQSLIARLRKLDSAAWPTHELSLEKASEDYAKYGCVTSFGNWREEINAIAIPMNLGDNLPLIVANSAAPVSVVSPDTYINEVLPELSAMVRAIENRYHSRKPQNPYQTR